MCRVAALLCFTLNSLRQLSLSIWPGRQSSSRAPPSESATLSGHRRECFSCRKLDYIKDNNIQSVPQWAPAAAAAGKGRTHARPKPIINIFLRFHLISARRIGRFHWFVLLLRPRLRRCVCTHSLITANRHDYSYAAIFRRNWGEPAVSTFAHNSDESIRSISSTETKNETFSLLLPSSRYLMRRNAEPEPNLIENDGTENYC